MEGSNAKKKPGYGRHKKENSAGHQPLSRQSPGDGSSDDTVQPRKLNGSSVDTPSYQNLHRELLLSHKRGLLLEEKPELKRVLEQRRLELHKEEEMARRRPSDLETELRKRQQKLQEYEQEEIRQRENQQKIPEFVRVKDNLRRTQTSEQLGLQAPISPCSISP
ncbi:protein FAM107B [Paralichthys olivaceus]|uniref:protein FAM107B n=1 Tax=Paralichthys olivaceus TaxID=8255 RepID=UPI00374FFCD8